MNHRRLSGVYAITDPELCADALLEKTRAAISGGIRILQYRNKSAQPSRQAEEATALKQLCHQHDVLFLINDDPELAIHVDADGVHLGQKDLTLPKARQVLGKQKIIGISCNNRVELALHAQQQGADYVAFGRFFPSQTKPEAQQADHDLLQRAKARLSLPIVAIGGITPENGATLIKQGVDMLAVIHGIFAQPDIQQATSDYERLFQS